MGSDNAKSLCKQCILGIAQLNTITLSGLDSCSNVKISGGLCKRCKAQVRVFYNCGAGKSLSVPANPTSPINQEVTSGVQVDYAPTTFCPQIFIMPDSGDSCSVPQGYKYLQCSYPVNTISRSGSIICTCRYDSNTYLCL